MLLQDEEIFQAIINGRPLGGEDYNNLLRTDFGLKLFPNGVPAWFTFDPEIIITMSEAVYKHYRPSIKFDIVQTMTVLNSIKMQPLLNDVIEYARENFPKALDAHNM